jgi:hypothetical protein
LKRQASRELCHKDKTSAGGGTILPPPETNFECYSAATGQRLISFSRFNYSKELAVSDENKPETEATPAAPAANEPAAQARQQVRVDDSKVTASYANFCRVTGTPEELIIDFGLNPQPFGIPTEPVVVSQRLVTNFFTAKRLLHALQLTLQRHEQAFGVLETDVQKRVMPNMRQPQTRS